MSTAGIICEYNPFHLAHEYHIGETRRVLGADTAIVCAMSGNFVQRGDFAVFEKHTRAAAAVKCGADLVLELPLPYVLSSAEGFAMGGVMLLNSLGICTHLSFGSECGDAGILREIAEILVSPEIEAHLKEELSSGSSFASARQRAAERIAGEELSLLNSPNNILGVEYLKALIKTGSGMEAFTVNRCGAQHDGDETGVFASASRLRKMLQKGEEPWGYMPRRSASLMREEIDRGYGPVFLSTSETAILAKLRSMGEEEYAALPDASEGLYLRLMRYAQKEPDLLSIAVNTKTKRYAMSRIRRMILCAYLGINASDSALPPPYIRVLAFNRRGMGLLRDISGNSALPVITKPAAAKELDGRALEMFKKEASATDLYVLGYPKADKRTGGQEWKISPRVVL